MGVPVVGAAAMHAAVSVLDGALVVGDDVGRSVAGELVDGLTVGICVTGDPEVGENVVGVVLGGRGDLVGLGVG